MHEQHILAEAPYLFVPHLAKVNSYYRTCTFTEVYLPRQLEPQNVLLETVAGMIHRCNASDCPDLEVLMQFYEKT